MALRIATRLPRLAILGVVLLLASATLAVGAAKRLTVVPTGAPAPVEAATLVVPDLSGQAFVFAKGSLEDLGFAWQVVGSVHGYAANKVATQSPPAGTRVRDTGAPTIIVKLARTPYPEKGEPEDVSPYVGTPVQPIRLATATSRHSRPLDCGSARGEGRRAEAVGCSSNDTDQARCDHGAATRIRRRRRAEGAAEGDAAAAAREAAVDVARLACEDAFERASLPVPAQLDRHRRVVRMVARRPGSP